MTKSLKLEIEDLEERIAPGLVLTTGLNSPDAIGVNTVNGPAAATAGAVTAFTQVVSHVPGGDIANLDVAFTC